MVGPVSKFKYRLNCDGGEGCGRSCGPFGCISSRPARRGEVRQWTVELKKTKNARGALYGHQSIKHGLNFVRGVFAAAVEDELIQTNPAEGVKPPKRRKSEQQDDWTALEPREIKRLLSHPELTFEQRTVFSLAIYTACARSRSAPCSAPTSSISTALTRTSP